MIFQFALVGSAARLGVEFIFVGESLMWGEVRGSSAGVQNIFLRDKQG